MEVKTNRTSFYAKS